MSSTSVAPVTLESGAETLTVEHVQPVREDAREEIHERHVDTLGTHQRHLYEIIRDAGEIGASELHARYKIGASPSE